jgi:hypothetical protein
MDDEEDHMGAFPDAHLYSKIYVLQLHEATCHYILGFLTKSVLHQMPWVL